MLAKLPAAGSKSFVHERGQATHPSVHSFVLCVVFFTKKKKCLRGKKVRQEGQDAQGNCLGVVQTLRQDGTKSGTESNEVG